MTNVTISLARTLVRLPLGWVGLPDHITHGIPGGKRVVA